MLKAEINNGELMVMGDNLNFKFSKQSTSEIVEVRINKESDVDNVYIYKAIGDEALIVSNKGYIVSVVKDDWTIINSEGEIVKTLASPANLPNMVMIPVEGELLEIAHPNYPFDYESLTNYNFTDRTLVMV